MRRIFQADSSGKCKNVVSDTCPDLWITPNYPPYPNGQWDNPDISLSAIPVVGTKVTITAKIHNSGSVDATAAIKFEWCHIGGQSAPHWIDTQSGISIPHGPVPTKITQSWEITSQAEGHSCVIVTIMQPTNPPECNKTPANSAQENLTVLPAPKKSYDRTLETAIPVMNPENMPMDIYIQFKKTYMPAGWNAWISDSLLEQVAPGDTQSVVVSFLIPATAMVGDYALANFEAFLSSPAGLHIGGTDIKAIVVQEQAPIPTLTEWGLIVLVLVLLALGTWVFFWRRKVVGVKT